jgi:hypothetical protein
MYAAERVHTIERMDSIEGAIELARMLSDRHGGEAPPLGPQGPLESADAPPIFHWLGIEPEPRAGDEDGA